MKRQQVQQLQVQAKEREAAFVRATEKEAEEGEEEAETFEEGAGVGRFG